MLSTKEKEIAFWNGVWFGVVGLLAGILFFGCFVSFVFGQEDPEVRQLVITGYTSREEALGVSSNAMWQAQSPEVRNDPKTITKYRWGVIEANNRNAWGLVVDVRETNTFPLAIRQRIVSRGTNGLWAVNKTGPNAETKNR